MKSSVSITALLVCMFFGFSELATATQEELPSDSAVTKADDFTFDPCQLKEVVCPYEKTIEEKIKEAARQANLAPSAILRIAKCESSLDAKAKNPNSSATGLYQFTTGTWAWIGAEAQGLDRTNPDHSIAMFVKWYPQHPGWWECK